MSSSMKLLFLVVLIVPFLTGIYAPLPVPTYEQMQHMAPPGGWERFQQQQQQTFTQPQPQYRQLQQQRHTFQTAQALQDDQDGTDTMLIAIDGDGGITTATAGGDAGQKMALTPQYQELPSKTQQTQFQMAAPAPVKQLAATNLPAETLQAQPGEMLTLQKLPQLTSQTTETLPLQMMAPAKTQTLQPQYRQQIINQDVIQPIVQTQPYLRVRHITQNVYQPTLQKQPVIQPIITQPVLNRVIHQQPIIQQQLQEQTVVKRRVINQPQVQQVLQTQYHKAPQQVQETMGEALPAQTQMNAKVAAILSGQANGGDGADQYQMQGQGQF